MMSKQGQFTFRTPETYLKQAKSKNKMKLLPKAMYQQYFYTYNLYKDLDIFQMNKQDFQFRLCNGVVLRSKLGGARFNPWSSRSEFSVVFSETCLNTG